MNRIAAVVNFCSNDFRFFQKSIFEISKFSNHIIVPVSDHFYNGLEENYRLLEAVYQNYPSCNFIEYSFSRELLYGPLLTSSRSEKEKAHYWHNVSRLCAFYYIPKDVDWVFFFDVDEIPEGDNILKCQFDAFDAVRFASYTYFREARFQSQLWQSAPLLVRKQLLTPEIMLDVNERKGLLNHIHGNKEGAMLGPSGRPLIHHYNWVRTQDEMHRKVATWAHRVDEENWEELIKNEFQTSFRGTDFFGEQSYREVSPYFDPLSIEIPAVPSSTLNNHVEQIKGMSYVMRVDPHMIFQKDLNWRFLDR